MCFVSAKRPLTEARLRELGAGVRSDLEVSIDAGTTREAVRAGRKRYGIPPALDRAKERIREAALNRHAREAETRDAAILAEWKASSAPSVSVVASSLGVSAQCVKDALRRHRLPVPNPRRRIDWKSVDWSNRTRDIAAQLDVDENLVSRHRVAAESQGRGVLRNSHGSHMDRATARAAELYASVPDWNVSNAEIATRLNLSGEQAASELRRKLRHRGFAVPRAPVASRQASAEDESDD